MAEKNLTIQEVSLLLGVSEEDILAYEAAGLVTPQKEKGFGKKYSYSMHDAQRIMSISLYQKLDLSLADIEKILQTNSLAGICGSFSTLIRNTEVEIKRLENQVQKMQFMRQHLYSLDKGVGNFLIKDLPTRYVLFSKDPKDAPIEKLAEVFNSPAYSYGNIGYNFSIGEDDSFAPTAVQFVVRDPMIDLIENGIRKSTLKSEPMCRCIYTVIETTGLPNEGWDMKQILDYARNIKVGHHNVLHCYYVFSILGKTEAETKNYYEIYLPIREFH